MTYSAYPIGEYCWLGRRLAAEEFGKAPEGNRQQQRLLAVFDSITAAHAAKQAEPT